MSRITNGEPYYLYGEHNKGELPEGLSYDSELKPCPFCGSRAILCNSERYPRPGCEKAEGWAVQCSNRNCILGNVDDNYALSKKEIIEIWNRRYNG
jgi:hypothetical protein